MAYTITSFRGGVSDENDKGIAGSFKFGYNLDIHSRDDVLKCGSSVTTLDESTITSLINYFVPASDGSTYAFGATGSIFAISGDKDDPAVTLVYNDYNGEIKGAEEWELSDGNNYLFWATNTSVARALMNGQLDTPWAAGVATQDWKTTLNSADWHTMKRASGSLFIANTESLSEVDFDGNFIVSSLNVRPGNLIKTLEERDDYVVLGSERVDGSEQGHIWSWIPIASKFVEKKKIPVQGVNALISTELPLLQGGDRGEIFLADFGDHPPLNSIMGGGKVMPGGVDIENDLASLGFYGGTYPGIWQFGRRMRNRPDVLNFGYRLAKTVSGSTISTVGAVSVMNGQLLASWQTQDGSTTDYGVDGISFTTKANALFESLEFDDGAPQLKKKFNAVKVVFSPLASGTSLSVKYKLDKATTGGDSSAGAGWKYAFVSGTSTTFSTSGETEAIFIVDGVAKIYEIGLELNGSGADSPEVHAIHTFMNEESYDY